MFGLFVLLVILSVCSKIEAQIPSFGSCPNVTAVANLNATRLVGVWYQAQRYFSVKNVGSSCNTCTFGVNVPALNGTSVIPSMYSQKQM